MTPEISLPKEAKKIYSYDTLTEHTLANEIEAPHEILRK